MDHVVSIRESTTFENIRTRLIEAGMASSDAVGLLQFAIDHLSEDWLTIWNDHHVRLQWDQKAQEVVELNIWAEILWGLFQLRQAGDIDRQIHRLNLTAPEKTNTAFVFLVSARYLYRGYTVRLEPNGPAGCDLLIEAHGFRTYVEIKRENTNLHERQQEWTRRALLIVEALRVREAHGLRDRGLRLEIHFSGLFSDETVPAIIDEIVDKLPQVAPNHDVGISAMPKSAMALASRDAPTRWPLGALVFAIDHAVHVGRDPSFNDADIVASMNWKPNFDAIRSNLRKALDQLGKERKKDPQASCAIVYQAADADNISQVVRSRMTGRFPPSLSGLVFIGSSATFWVLPRDSAPPGTVEFLGWAGRSIWARTDDVSVRRDERLRIVEEMAYFKWLDSGRRDGAALDDWLWAEQAFNQRFRVID